MKTSTTGSKRGGAAKGEGAAPGPSFNRPLRKGKARILAAPSAGGDAAATKPPAAAPKSKPSRGAR